MGSCAIQIGRVAFAVLGLFLLTVCCAVPSWTSWTANIESHSVTVQAGLWKVCTEVTTGQLVCADYQNLPSGLPPIRAMTVISCMLTYLGFLILLILGFCPKVIPFLQNEDAKPKVRVGVGVGLLLAGLLVIISVARFPTILEKALGGGVSGLSKGGGFFAGLAAGLLLLLGGGLLCYYRKDIP